MTLAVPSRRVPPAGPDLDAAALSRWLRPRLPGFDEPCLASAIAGGRSNPTFVLESANGRYVLRRRPAGPSAPSAHNIEREFRVLTALQGSAVPVPRPLLLCTDASVIGSAFYVMSHVEGRVDEDPRLPTFAREARHRLYLTAADAAAALHGLDPHAVGLGDFGPPGGYVRRQLRRWTDAFRQTQVQDAPEMDRLIAWLDANGPSQATTALTHGDYRFGNLLIGADGADLAAVLDWELSTLGDPLCDLAYLAMPFRVAPDTAPLAMLAGLDPAAHGLPSEAALLDRYAAASGRSIPADWPAYLAFAFFRCAAIAQGVRARQGPSAARDACDLVRALAQTGLRIARGG